MTIKEAQRNTKQRQVVLEELRKVTSHPTAATLYEFVRRRLPKISLGTVYRNLELMVRMGVIRKIDFSGSEARYDGNIVPHDHLRCVQCGRVDDVSAVPLDHSGEATNDCCGYEILGYRLEFFGICPRCRERTKDNDARGKKHSTHVSNDNSPVTLKKHPKPR